jgi:hypothetical protein
MTEKKKWIKLDKKRPVPLNLVKYPWGASTVNKSHENSRGLSPASEVTQPYNIYDIPSTSNADHSTTFPGKGEGVYPISTSGKRWIK